MKLKFRRIESSNIHSVAYSSNINVLVIKFTSGQIYSFYNVPRSEYQRFLNADSHGTYFNENIRYSYKYQYHDYPSATMGEKELLRLLQASIARQEHLDLHREKGK